MLCNDLDESKDYTVLKSPQLASNKYEVCKHKIAANSIDTSNMDSKK